jgi:hypothetical protein
MSANRACSEKPIQRHDAVLSSGEIIMLLSNSSAWPFAGKSLVDDVPRYDQFFRVNPCCAGNGTHLDIYNVQGSDTAFFKPEMICTASWGFGMQETGGKGIEDVL